MLLQCTDPEVFKCPEEKVITHELLFVGNSRKVYRKVIKDVLPSEYNLSIYGSKWRGIVEDSYIKGEHIENKELYKYYHGAKIVLNDHWEDMSEKGFISNRIFDVLASKGFLITDEVEGLRECLGDAVVTYKDKEDLQSKIKYYMEHEEERIKKCEEGYQKVISEHTFKQRMQEVISDLEDNN